VTADTDPQSASPHDGQLELAVQSFAFKSDRYRVLVAMSGSPVGNLNTRSEMFINYAVDPV
jgi:hypothetical protein